MTCYSALGYLSVMRFCARPVIEPVGQDWNRVLLGVASLQQHRDQVAEKNSALTFCTLCSLSATQVEFSSCVVCFLSMNNFHFHSNIKLLPCLRLRFCCGFLIIIIHHYIFPKLVLRVHEHSTMFLVIGHLRLKDMHSIRILGCQNQAELAVLIKDDMNVFLLADEF